LHARHDNLTNYFQYKGPCCDLQSTSYLFRIEGNKKTQTNTLHCVKKYWAFQKRYNVSIYLLEEFEDTKGVIRIRKSMKDWQHND